MNRGTSIGVVLACVALLIVAIAPGCGGSAAVVAPTDGGGATCKVLGAACTAGSECCSNDCDSTHACTGGLGACGAAGSSCSSTTACCSLTCSGGKCGSTTCISDNQACSASADCCGGNCTAGKCVPLSTSCKTAGNQCAANGDCCSALCSNGHCSLNSSYCAQTGDVCTQASACCSGTCNVAMGQTLGTCGAPPTGPSFCQGGVDGTVCTDCTGCCSRLCAPYGLTGVKICQPAQGCHVDGDLCTKDSDCCGAAGSGLPGDGNVTCVIQSGQTVGICRNPMGCNPEGDVCHYQNYACSISSARNDCCGAPGNSGACQLDKEGVPRCMALGACVMVGGACASSADCCNGVPCVPDQNGKLHCAMSCSPSTGPCTVDADCCSGLHCTVPFGSTQGTCGAVPPPPPGQDGGANGMCSLYGQPCKTNADCCNNVPCSLGTAACTGQTTCTCVYPVQ